MTPDELRAWRVAHRMSQPALADALGVHWQTVAHWEQGQRSIPPLLTLALKGIERKGTCNGND